MVRMYRQPMHTRNPSQDQTFCSVIFDTIGRKLNKNSFEKSPNEAQKKGRRNSLSEKPNGKNTNNIESVVKKLKRLTNSLPVVLQHSDAFEPGEKSCKTCSMTKESYKKEINHSRIVDKLVEGVIDKEQSESINRQSSSEDSNLEKNKKSPKDKGDKFSIAFEVYCEGDPIKHNLKCLLINLQQTIRDILVQIAFVKTRNLGKEERYKPFDISVNDFKFLKYEYSNLLDVIVPLLHKLKPTKKDEAQVCVTCVKERLLVYNDILQEVLTKHGRDLKIVMRNENMEQGEGKCCARDYPHVHADVQGRPIVLKYSMPIKIKTDKDKPDQAQDPVVLQKVESTGSNAFSKLNREGDPEKKHKNETKKQKKEPKPYYEWPKNYFENKHESLEDDYSSQGAENSFKSLSKTSKSDSESETKNTLYCGCNFNKVFTELNIENDTLAQKESSIDTEIENTPSSKQSKINVYTATNKDNIANPFVEEITDTPVIIHTTDSIITNRKRLSESVSKYKLFPTTLHLNTPLNENQTKYPEQNLGKSESRVFLDPRPNSQENTACSVEYHTENMKDSISYLPFTPSMRSLPFNKDDKDYIASEFGENISFEDIMIVTEDEIPSKEFQWELDFAKEELNSFGNGKPNSTPQVNSSGMNCNNHRLSVSFKVDPEVLPAIIEEEELTSTVPVIKASSKPQSILKHQMELRYLSVDFPKHMDISKCIKECEYNRSKTEMTNQTNKLMNKIHKEKGLNTKDIDKESKITDLNETIMVQVINLCHEQLNN